jgi:FkbM family methyltransferase
MVSRYQHYWRNCIMSSEKSSSYSAQCANTPRRLDGTIVLFEYEGEELTFFVLDRGDVIQHHYLQGRLFEEDELRIIARYFPPGGVFVDIGANVGNHSIFASRFLHARKVIAFEPHPTAAFLLKANVALNRLADRIDTSHLGIGLCDRDSQADAVLIEGNLGATRLRASADEGAFQVVPGDALLADRSIDFIKIDVEGMEIEVLRGLGRTITQQRPAILVEVDNPNTESFITWVRANQYICKYCSTGRVWDTLPDYAGYANFLIVPAEMGPAA